MREEMIALGPEHWTLLDLDGPTDECQVPEPIRPPDSVGVWHTCPHCHVRFILVDLIDDRIWVSAAQHNQMCAAMEAEVNYEEGWPFDQQWRDRW